MWFQVCSSRAARLLRAAVVEHVAEGDEKLLGLKALELPAEDAAAEHGPRPEVVLQAESGVEPRSRRLRQGIADITDCVKITDP